MTLLSPIPLPVAHADFAALEWRPLLGLLAGYASSSVGREGILALVPSADAEWIADEHGLVGELRLLLEEQVSVPVGGLFDPTQLAAKAQIPEAALEADELQAVARLARDVAAWQGLLQSPPARLAGRLTGLSEISAGLGLSLKPLAESIERTIQPDGSLADDASSELARIRREQERQQRLIEASLRTALRKLSSDGATQAVERRRYAGRPHHDSRREVCDSRAQRAEAARGRCGARRKLIGADGVCGTA